MEKNINKSIKISLLGAMALVLMFFEFPLIPMFSWLKMDFSELPVFIGSFLFGPIVGVLIEFLKIILYLLLKGSHTGGVGELANFLVGVSFIVPSAIIYRKNRCKKGYLIGMIIGGLIMEIVAVIANVYLLIPAYGMVMDSSQTIKYITAGLIPFNTIKIILISIIVAIIYGRIKDVVVAKTN